MHIRYLKSILNPSNSDQCNKICAPNNTKLAIATNDKFIQIFDETGERKDKFPVKSADPKTKSFTIVALAWSPDSTRLAIAQSDSVVFVYKLGLEWGEKKSICNKFIQSSEVTCLSWPLEQPNALIFGLVDGKVRIGNLKTNKSATLYQAESCTISLTSNLEGNAIVSGHLDHSIYRFFFDDQTAGASQGKFTLHKCPPTCLSWGENLAVSGSDKCIVFYDSQGITFV